MTQIRDLIPLYTDQRPQRNGKTSKYATNKGVKCLNETNVTETMVNAKIFLDGGRMC